MIKFYTSTGEAAEAHDGSLIEWDVICGFGIPGTGMIVKIGEGDYPPPMFLYLDKNQGLRSMAAEMLESMAGLREKTGFPLKKIVRDGMDGEGGFVIMAGDAFADGVRNGTIRILDERRPLCNAQVELDQWIAKRTQCTCTDSGGVIDRMYEVRWRI